jgi:hypothetical protein
MVLTCHQQRNPGKLKRFKEKSNLGLRQFEHMHQLIGF